MVFEGPVALRAGPFFMGESMQLESALKLVRSGGKVMLENRRVELTERRGVLFIRVKDGQTIITEKVLRDLYWRESWICSQ